MYAISITNPSSPPLLAPARISKSTHRKKAVVDRREELLLHWVAENPSSQCVLYTQPTTGLADIKTSNRRIMLIRLPRPRTPHSYSPPPPPAFSFTHGSHLGNPTRRTHQNFILFSHKIHLAPFAPRSPRTNRLQRKAKPHPGEGGGWN